MLNDMTNHTKNQITIYQLGTLHSGRYWLQCPDGRICQLDTDSKHVLLRLANQESISDISRELNVEEDAILELLKVLGLDADSHFTIEMDSQSAYTYSENHFIPWIEKPWFKWFIGFFVTSSLTILFLFFKSKPPILISGLYEQWIIAGCLTFAVLCHELGHFLTMPRHQHISMFIQWSGPLPMLSILSQEAWKLPKNKRMRINIAGFIVDIIICGIAASLGLWIESLVPWIWTFLLIQMIRMCFAIWPLLPGDGYWMLVDLFDQPNLWSKALNHLKQLRLSWLSFYALARSLFLVLIWFLYLSIIWYWSMIFSSRPFEEAIKLFLYPAPLLIFLTLMSQLYFLIVYISKPFKRFVKLLHFRKSHSS